MTLCFRLRLSDDEGPLQSSLYFRFQARSRRSPECSVHLQFDLSDGVELTRPVFPTYEPSAIGVSSMLA